MNKLIILLLPLIFSCRDSKWEITPANKFLIEKAIDTSTYSTLEELFLKGVIRKITTSDSDYVDNHTHFSLPLVYDQKYDYTKTICLDETSIYLNRKKIHPR